MELTYGLIEKVGIKSTCNRNPFHLQIGSFGTRSAESQTLVQPHCGRKSYDVQRDRFIRGGGFLHQILYQTTSDTGVSILSQECNVSQHYRRLASINEYSANRASVQKNDSIIDSRIGSFTSIKLHFDERSLLIVRPTCCCQFIHTRTRVNFQ